MVELTAEQQVFIVLNYTLKVLTNSKEMHKVWFNCVLYAPVGLKKHSNKPFKFQQRLDFKRYTFFRVTLYIYETTFPHVFPYVCMLIRMVIMLVIENKHYT